MHSEQKFWLEFGEYQADPLRRVLLRNGKPVRIPAKAFDVLLELLQRPGEVVSKQQLMDFVWPDVAVEENNLARHVSTLRRVLGEKPGEHRYLLTVPGHGYGFVAEVQEIPAPAAVRTRLVPLLSRGTSRAVWTRLAFPLALSALAVFVSAAFYYRGSRVEQAVERFSDVSLTPIKSTPSFPRAVISPDGSYIAYLTGERGRHELWVHSPQVGSDWVLAPALAGHSVRGIAFSPDSARLYYNVHADDQHHDELWTLPVLGGEPEKLIESLESPVTFHPDGSQFAFVRETPEGESVLVTASLVGGEEREIASRQLSVFLDYPAWSPDGSRIAFSEVTPTGVTVREVRLDTGVEKRLALEVFDYVQRFAWLPDLTGLVLSARLVKPQPYSLWHLSYPEGKLSRITDNLESLRWASMTADGQTILTSAERAHATLWVTGLDRQAAAQRVVSVSGNLILHRWLKDGRILFEEQVGSERSLSTIQPDGSGRERREIHRSGPDADLCADDRTLVSWADYSGRSAIWRTDLTRGTSNPVVEVNGPVSPRCSPDGQWVVYTTKAGEPWETMWKMPLAGGEPQRLTSLHSLLPAFSPDGRSVACFYAPTAPSPQREPNHIAVLDINEEGPTDVFPVAASVSRDVELRWSADGTMVTYVDNREGVSNIWGQPVAGGAPRQLTDFQQGLIFSFDWSPDGRQLSLLRGSRSWDIVLIRGRQSIETAETPEP
jgi:DNA-binding winged helix-turn-helix (wHTH) protein/Tol biopolymer transport system component